MIVDEEVYLEHYGQKGMRWGVRKKVTYAERRAGRKEVRSVAKSASRAVRASRRANSSAERAAVAKQYEHDVLKRVGTKEFKTAFQNANTMGKGEMATHVLLLGPFAALTIPAMRKQYAVNQTIGVETNKAAARQVLKGLKSL